ncbi:MAG: hypothetical protein QOJ03_2962 [Frankiaceae bacterium]|nr:hypothetical protein [Frankiaceae bacterium]
MHARRMTEPSVATGRGDYLLGRAALLLRLAHQLTGDPGEALALLCRAAASVPTRRRQSSDLDLLLTTAIVRSTIRGGHPGPEELAIRAADRRSTVVLAFGLGWDAETIAEVRRTTPRRVRRDVAAALALRTDAGWRAVLADPAWSLPVPADLLDRVRASRRGTRSRRRRTALAVCAAATAVAGVIVAVDRVVTAPPPAPPTAHVAGLLDWPARGELIRDESFIRAATLKWRSARTHSPAGKVFVLYAGRVGVGRIAVLQSLFREGGSEPVGMVAVVADHDVSFRHARLHLDLVSPLLRLQTPALAIPYDGNLNIPGLVAGPGSRVEQLLVAPDVERVQERDLRGPLLDTRPPFVSRPLTFGMSEPWLDLTGTGPSTAVRLSRPGTVPFTGILTVGALQPLEIAATAPSPLPAWSGLPRSFPPSALRDDVLWWSQVCGLPAPAVQLVWVGRIPAFTAPVRLEIVRCPGGILNAEFITGVAAGTLAIAQKTGDADAYAAELVPPTLGHSTVLVVGSARVARIDVGDVRTDGRVAAVPVEQAGPVHVVSGTGTPLRVR